MEKVDVKHALEHYHEIREAARRTQDKIDAVNAQRFKAGSSIITIPETTSSPDQKIIRNMERHDKLMKEYQRYHDDMVTADSFIQAIPARYRDMVVDKYVHRLNCHKMQQKYNYDRTQMFRIINRLIEAFIEKT